METIVKLNKFANASTNIGTDALRLLFGGFIFYKGLFFLTQTEYLAEILPFSSPEDIYFLLVYYVGFTHLLGGFFTMMGLLTRISSLMQLPILVGAVLINFIAKMDYLNMAEASAALALCICFLFFGSGKHSLDYSLKLNM